MKILFIVAMMICAFLAIFAPATAVTITNEDNEVWTIAVTVGETRTEYTIGGGKAVAVECDPSCSVNLVATLGDKHRIVRVIDNNVLSIKKGQLKFGRG